MDLEIQEKIIRGEAKSFTEHVLKNALHNPSGGKTFQRDLKLELGNFYQTERKMIFLDEVNEQVIGDLKKHRINCPNYLSGKACPREAKIENVLFYIQQEIEELPHLVKPNKKTDPLRSSVFISYSRIDIEFLNQLKRHTKPFQDRIDIWEDSKIMPGDKWKDEITKAIKQCKIAVLLVSADFFASDFIMQKELPSLLQAAEEEGATILTVILKPCLFEAFDNINKYQAINSPKNPISQMNENDREITWVELVRQIKRIIG